MTDNSKSLTIPEKKYAAISSYGRSEEVMSVFAQMLGHQAPYYIQSALLAVKSNPALIECTPKSIFSAALRAATLQLSCDPALGHAWMVPYRNNRTGVSEASFQPGWKGIQHLALRSGKYRYINVSPIYEGEDVEEDRITGELRLVGNFISKKEIGYIASFKLLNGFGKSIYMTVEELEEHGKRYSKGYNRSDSIWQTNKKAAYHKTIILRLLRTHGYLEPRVQAFLEADETDGSGELEEVALPEQSDVTVIEEQKPKTLAEARSALGFDAPDDDIVDAEFEEAEPKPLVLPLLTIEDACKATMADGKPYHKLPQKNLETIIENLNKSLTENHLSDEAREDQTFKLAAARTILLAKRDGSLN